MNENIEIIQYDKVPKENLIRAAKNIKQFENQQLRNLVQNSFISYHKDVILDADKYLSFSIKTITLINVSNAVVLVSFDAYPLEGFNGIKIAGQARLIKTSLQNNNIYIPVIYLTPYATDKTLEHEKIHICQYLKDSLYPLTNDQRELFLSKNLKDSISYLLKNSNKDDAINFIINASCAKLWIEMEANYFTVKNLSIFEWIKKVYLSSQPIFTCEALYEIESLSMNNDDMEKIRERFSSFCNKIENEVPWIRNHILKDSGIDSLHELILEAHDEVETEYMFGPIDENEFDDISEGDIFDDYD